ncbi:hypothetical protein CH373_00075 [Leptospira perolatii]|uniref:Uncharacterized protein n=1 Tax=Leptospira perolatii TaxID=2023191 RepID=A0A2M9ZR03_9LEPT|nr:hypothetical protein [Leptospira perolatii]PJZ70976.1 hypothetical protein CH360_00075 [Leptospira perolatii]PJZ74508.1 hypothetical protein CH373_00075 [Leptospira perolatii]
MVLEFLYAASERFRPSIIEDLKPGYTDSVFINKAGDRIYFLHSHFAPLVLLGGSPNPSACSTGRILPGHTSDPGLEWNTDLYYVEWNGFDWSEPINLGSKVNTLGMENTFGENLHFPERKPTYFTFDLIQ